MARRNRNSSRNKSAPGWVWMLFGLSLGLIVAIGVYLRAPSAPRAARAAPAAAAPAAAERPTARTAPRVASANQREAPENRFDFYEILPQAEVVIPDESA